MQIDEGPGPVQQGLPVLGGLSQIFIQPVQGRLQFSQPEKQAGLFQEEFGAQALGRDLLQGGCGRGPLSRGLIVLARIIAGILGQLEENCGFLQTQLGITGQVGRIVILCRGLGQTTRSIGQGLGQLLPGRGVLGHLGHIFLIIMSGLVPFFLIKMHLTQKQQEFRVPPVNVLQNLNGILITSGIGVG